MQCIGIRRRLGLSGVNYIWSGLGIARWKQGRRTGRGVDTLVLLYVCRWSGPYLKRIISSVKADYPTVPLTLYANGSGGLLERLAATGVDVVGVDWTTDMADARRRIDSNVSLQGNVDPAILFASQVRAVRGT
jgi:hypothetical protein